MREELRLSSLVLAELVGSLSVRLADIFFRFVWRSRESKAQESRKGWVHHVKVEECEMFFRERKCFRVLRVSYPSISIPVLGRN